MVEPRQKTFPYGADVVLNEQRKLPPGAEASYEWWVGLVTQPIEAGVAFTAVYGLLSGGALFLIAPLIFVYAWGISFIAVIQQAFMSWFGK